MWLQRAEDGFVWAVASTMTGLGVVCLLGEAFDGCKHAAAEEVIVLVEWGVVFHTVEDR